MLRPTLSFALLFALMSGALAAPLSLKELDLLVRMRVPEQEIIRDLEKRRLLAPLDAASEQQLIKNGASAGLIQRLKTGSYAVSSQEATTLQQREMDRQALIAEEKASDAAAFAAREQQQRQQVSGPVADTMRRMFDGKLVRMENGDLRSYSADELRNTRYYALYYSAYWCGPCRKFTPQLVEFYKRFKAQHPDFEVIFISSDYNPGSMQAYMKSAGMPWPAVKYEQIDKSLRSMAGSGIPWLGIYDAAGQPVSSNGTTKQWVDPSLVLRAFEQAMPQPQTAAR